MANFTIISAQYINQPASEVGDITINVANRAVTILTSAMFTSGTTPPYSDPENNPAEAVRIDNLPSVGTLNYNSNPVIVGQIITITNINANLLVYTSPNQDASIQAQFTFSVRDSGSMQFVS